MFTYNIYKVKLCIGNGENDRSIYAFITENQTIPFGKPEENWEP